MFTVRGNNRAEALLLFRSPPLQIDFRDQASQQALLRRRIAGMGWQTDRLVAAMPDAYDFYFDEMSQVKMPSWSAGRVVLPLSAAAGPPARPAHHWGRGTPRPGRDPCTARRSAWRYRPDPPGPR